MPSSVTSRRTVQYENMGRIDYQAPVEVQNVIAELGRTEDIKFSPDNTRLGVVSFQTNKIYLFKVDIDTSTTVPGIILSGCAVISSRNLRQPHGIAFLDETHLIVCNRSGGVNIFMLPPAKPGVFDYNLRPVGSISGKGMLFAKVKTPGSVACYRTANDRYRVLVCNNYWNFISSHTIDIGRSVRIRNEGVLAEKAIKVPDGICIDNDSSHIAISNHADGNILVYRNTPALNRKTPPTAVLSGVVCPHGIRFSHDRNRLLVADAASQYLHIYEKNDDRWKDATRPSRSVRLVDEESFRCRHDRTEGGIKGIDIDTNNRILATSRRYDVIAFYDLAIILNRSDPLEEKKWALLSQQRTLALKNKRLDQRWDLRTRARHAIAPALKKLKILKWVFSLYRLNVFSRQPIIDPRGPVVSLTTYGPKLLLAFLTIESIGRGYEKPSRLILWLQNRKSYNNPPRALKRLKNRGLEIRFSEPLGPHAKYYPFIQHEEDLRSPLVTANDNVLYPRTWLQQLNHALNSDPDSIHCFRAYRMVLTKTRLAPCEEWTKCLGSSPSHLNYVAGVSGVIYPPEFIRLLKNQGAAFLETCPTADDIWMTVNALRGGFKIAQVTDQSSSFPWVPGAHKQRANGTFLTEGDQRQLHDSFSKRDLDDLHDHLLSEVDSLPAV